jgi:MYXO-CTERM domain-containing protein
MTAYPMAFAPLLVLRDECLYQRTVAALAVVIAASLLCFALLPVSTAGLRPHAAVLRGPGFTAWALRGLYALDPPRNAFPSLHLAIGTVIALAAGRGDRMLRLAGAGWLSALALSASLVKQHFVADTAAGLLLGAAADAWIVRPAAHSSASGGTSRRGALALLGVAALFYASLCAVFRFFG